MFAHQLIDEDVAAPDTARQLLRAKEKVRATDKLQEKHLERLRADMEASFASSRMHQESLRIIKSVNTAFATIGHPIAARSGDLLSTRQSKKPNSKDMKQGRAGNKDKQFDLLMIGVGN